MLHVHRVVKTHDGRFLTPKMLLLEVQEHILRFPDTYHQNKVGRPEGTAMCSGMWARSIIVGCGGVCMKGVELPHIGQFLTGASEPEMPWLFLTDFHSGPTNIRELFFATNTLSPYLREEQLQHIRADIAAKAIDLFIAEKGYTE